MSSILFKDRRDAGKKLAQELAEYKLSEGIIFAIPRGGVIIGAEIANKLKLDLDLIIPRKIGSPLNPEVAVGAVAQDGTVIFSQELLDRLGLTKDDFQDQIKNEIKEINRRMELYRKNSSYPNYNLKNIILVDDGIATGYTVFAAIDFIKKRFNPDQIILAVPVAPPDIINKLKNKVEKIKCLSIPKEFYAVGQFYQNFEQNSDREVITIMRKFGLHKEV